MIPRAPLNARTGVAPRRGALLNIAGGFADVHPWPELGDAPLDEQLALLAGGQTTPLTRQSLAMAQRDAAARRSQVSLFESLPMTRNHWPLAAGDVPSAFDTVKIKLGPGGHIPPGLDGLKLRIDFNSTLDEEQLASFVKTLTSEDQIEFLEDPLPWNEQRWARARALHRLPMALDRGLATAGADVLVVKPAIQDVDRAIQSGLELVVTSYMDHPVGVLHAALIAAELQARHPARVRQSGLLTHLLYEPDPFSERLRLDGTRLVPPSGTGIGFDDLLSALHWRPLS